jgi:hypothetical protein
MGIDFSHCNAHWGYGGFNNFRTRLAKEVGIDLEEMDGFGGHILWEGLVDPIIPLLCHSDCDGELSVEECKKVAPRLKEIVDKWLDDYDKQTAVELVKGMETAIGLDEPIRFC